MSCSGTFTSFVSTPAQTDALGIAITAHLSAGDVILLTGDVGAGKTHFARALINSMLTTPEDIPSPTFTLVQTYHTNRGEIWHADLYRLTDVTEIEELGLLQAFVEAICLVEWPERLGALCPQDALNIHFQQSDTPDGRLITFSWSDKRWESAMSEMQNV